MVGKEVHIMLQKLAQSFESYFCLSYNIGISSVILTTACLALFCLLRKLYTSQKSSVILFVH